MKTGTLALGFGVKGVGKIPTIPCNGQTGHPNLSTVLFLLYGKPTEEGKQNDGGTRAQYDRPSAFGPSMAAAQSG